MKGKDYFVISNKKFNSRLIVGTGKYKNFQECAKSIKASGADIVTVAVRRVNISDKKTFINGLFKSKKNYLSTKYCWVVLILKMHCEHLRLAREIGGWKLVKLEILGDKKTLLPDMIETLKSTEF